MIKEVNNITGALLVENVHVKSEKPKKIIVNGLLLPKDKISRNQVLYDWGSIKSNYSKLIGMSMAYNHRIEEDQLPVGHFTDSVLIENTPEEGSKWKKIWDITTEKNDGVEQPGWYYEADIRPGTEIAECILRGDLSKVSVQVMADKAVPEENEETGQKYKRAFIGSVIEASPVISPGFQQTTMEVALAEAFKVKEGQTTAGNPGATGTLLVKKDEEAIPKDVKDKYNKVSRKLYGKDYDDLGPIQQTKVRKYERKYGVFIESVNSDVYGVFPLNEFLLELASRVSMVDKFNYEEVLREAKVIVESLGEEPKLELKL